MAIKDTLTTVTDGFKTKLDDEMRQRFEIYFKLLVEWNEKMNLTAITDEHGVAVKHFADSLTLYNFVDVKKNASIIDVGTGAGFPGVVLKIARPDIKLTLLDSLNKRLTFLDTVLNDTVLDAELVHSRAEEGGKNKLYREKFDIVTARAVANLKILSELCIPMVKVNGLFIAMKANIEEEIENSTEILKKLDVNKDYNVVKLSNYKSKAYCKVFYIRLLQFLSFQVQQLFCLPQSYRLRHQLFLRSMISNQN